MMKLERLDHVNIRTHQITRLQTFYESVIGLQLGPRPALDSNGVWLYLNGRDILHLVASSTAQPASEPQLEHFALRATGYQDFIKHLDSQGIPYRANKLGNSQLQQLHLNDPDGNHLEINFASEDE